MKKKSSPKKATPGPGKAQGKKSLPLRDPHPNCEDEQAAYDAAAEDLIAKTADKAAADAAYQTALIAFEITSQNLTNCLRG